MSTQIRTIAGALARVTALAACTSTAMRPFIAVRIGLAVLGLATASPAWAEPAPSLTCRQAMAQQPAIVAGRHHQPTIAEIAQKEAACRPARPARQEQPRPLSAIG